MTADQGGPPARQQPADAQLEIWSEMVSVERERIASRDRATEVMREGFAKLDAADERHFQFQTDSLRRADEFRNRRLTHVMRLTWVFVSTAIIMIGLALFMFFWGTEEQRSAATPLVTHALSAGGFFAAGYLLGRRSKS